MRRGHNILPVSDWFTQEGHAHAVAVLKDGVLRGRRRPARRRRGCGILGYASHPIDRGGPGVGAGPAGSGRRGQLGRHRARATPRSSRCASATARRPRKRSRRSRPTTPRRGSTRAPRRRSGINRHGGGFRHPQARRLQAERRPRLRPRAQAEHLSPSRPSSTAGGCRRRPAIKDGFPTMIYEEGLVVVFDKQSSLGGIHDLHRRRSPSSSPRGRCRARRSGAPAPPSATTAPKPGTEPRPPARARSGWSISSSRFDPGGRGIARFFVPGGAARAARALRRAKRVLLTTGFSLGPGLPETDGPPGTASLGRALRALGAEVTYITDAAALPPLQAALERARRADPDPDLPRGRRRRAHGAAAPGRARADPPRRHRAPGAHARRRLPEHARRVRRRVERRRSTRSFSKPRGGWSRSASATEATRSAWARCGARLRPRGSADQEGRLGRARAARGRRRRVELGRVRHRRRAGAALEAPARCTPRSEERRMVRACVAAGAVDGITRKREATVDALPLEAHAGMVELMRLIQDSTPHGGKTR